MIIFLIQCTLLVLVSESFDGDIYKAVEYKLVIMRFICVLFLHIQITPEIEQALMMFKYQRNHPDNFTDMEKRSTQLPCTMIFLMQMTTALATEIINFYLILEA